MQKGERMEQTFRETKQDITLFFSVNLDFPAHIHEDIELIYVIKGGGTAQCDGKEYHLTPGSFFTVFPNQVHRYSDTANGEYILVIVKPTELIHHSDIFFKGYPTSALCTQADKHTSMLLEMALEEYEQTGYTSVIHAYLTVFFEKLITFYDIAKRNVSTDIVMRILQYCAAHYREDITVGDIAAELHISRSSVSHVFSDRLGISFCDHIHTLRLEDAVHLLKDGHHSITEIAEIAGFPTIRTFNRVFGQHYGMSPSAYRKSLTE